MRFFDNIGLNNTEVVSYTDRRMKDSSKVRYRIVSENHEDKELELYFLNSYFLKFLKSDKALVERELRNVVEDFEYSETDERADGIIRNKILTMFHSYMTDDADNGESFISDLKESEKAPLEFDIFYPKTPFAVQRTQANLQNRYIVVVYTSKESEIDTSKRNKKNLFLQIHTCLVKAKIYDVSPNVYINKLEPSTLSVLGISDYAKETIRNGNGIAFIQTTDKNPTLKGVYEIVNT